MSNIDNTKKKAQIWKYCMQKVTCQTQVQLNKLNEHLEIGSFFSTATFAILSVWELGRQIAEHYHYGFTSRNAPTLNECSQSFVGRGAASQV